MFFLAENFGRSLEGQGGPTRGSEVFNTIIQMEAGHLREKHKLLNSKKHFKQSPKGCKRLMAFFSGEQSSHQTQRNNKKLTSSGFKQQPICTPLAPTRSKIIYKTPGICSSMFMSMRYRPLFDNFMEFDDFAW